MNNQFVKWEIISIGVLFNIGMLIILFALLPFVLDTTPIRPHENDVVFDGYTIIALVCYNCSTIFELGEGGYINGRIWCNHCIEIVGKEGIE